MIEPLFEPGTLRIDLAKAKEKYCIWNETMFNGFTAIDRMTVLNDIDGSLTGLVAQVSSGNPPTQQEKPTLSINLDEFFDAPLQTPECASDLPLNAMQDAKELPATANTSPFEYFTTVAFPGCAKNGAACPDDPVDKKPVWSVPCTDASCYGVPLYRQLLRSGELEGVRQRVRMMGQAKSQRSSLTVNLGTYYIDTAVRRETQLKSANFINGFQKGESCYVFFVYARPTTKQTNQIYVGDDPDYKAEDKVKFTRVRIPGDFRFFPEKTWPDGWERSYQNGILTVTVDMSSLKDDFDLTKNDLGKEPCQPASMCSWDEGANVCKFDTAKSADPRFAGRSTTDLDEICAWSVREIDCPKDGCIGFRFTMADKFVADDANHRPPPQPFATDSLWNGIQVSFKNVLQGIAGAKCYYPTPPLAQ